MRTLTAIIVTGLLVLLGGLQSVQAKPSECSRSSTPPIVGTCTPVHVEPPAAQGTPGITLPPTDTE